MTSSGIPPARVPLHSTRLIGEPVERAHAAAMVRVLADPRIHAFLPGDPPNLEALEDRYAYLSAGKSPDGSEHWLTWILKLRELDQDPIGYVQATVCEPQTVHVAYVLAPIHWGHGYGPEAVTALLDSVFRTYEVERAVIEMDTRNKASRSLAEGLGFQFVKTVPAADEYKGHEVDENVFELAAAEWLARRPGIDSQA